MRRVFTAALADANELNMDIQNVYGTKDTSGPLSSVNPPISVAAPKPLSYNMDSRYVFPKKIPSFAYSYVYPPMSLNSPESFGGGI